MVVYYAKEIAKEDAELRTPTAVKGGKARKLGGLRRVYTFHEQDFDGAVRHRSKLEVTCVANMEMNLNRVRNECEGTDKAGANV